MEVCIIIAHVVRFEGPYYRKNLTVIFMMLCSQLGLVLSEDDRKEKVKAAKARTNLLQGKLDFYVNSNL